MTAGQNRSTRRGATTFAFRLQREPVQLPPRVRHQDYVRHPVPASMIVPARY